MRAPHVPILFRKNILLFALVVLGNSLFGFTTLAQDCQSSSDYQDVHGSDFGDGREFRCGTGMMQEEMHRQRAIREKKGYFDIEGLNFYGSSGYYKKGNKLYYSPNQETFTLVSDGDVGSLKIEGNFIRDANHVYSDGKAQKIVSAKAFAALPNTPYAMDDAHVYYNASRGGHNSTENIQVVEGADPKSFKTLCDQNSNGMCYQYAKDNLHVYYSGQLIQGADASSFALGEMGYAQDLKFVYYNGLKLEGSDAKSFKMVDYYYMQDKNNVYIHGEIIPGMNGSKFELIGTSGMGTDGTHICSQSVVFANSDPSSLVDMGCGYYKDVNNVYSKGQILQHIDAGSFELLSWGFTKDQQHVYCDDEVIPNANPAEFEVLGRKYARDKKQVYYLRTTISGADLASFRADEEDPSKGEDAKATYYRGKRTAK